jgi:tripartite motif-containing protein 23
MQREPLLLVITLSIFTSFILAGPICEECTSTAAHFWCRDCKHDLCETCCTRLHQGRTLSQHRRIPINDKPIEPMPCVEHPEEKLRYWCSCEAVICRDCQLSEKHRDHKPALIVEVASKITEEVSIRS